MDDEHKRQIQGFTMSVSDNHKLKGAIRLGEIQDFQKGQKKQQSGSTDPRLGSAVYNDDTCPTCQLDGKNCPGHFGYVDLQGRPLYNPIFLQMLQYVLQIICIKCGYVVLQEKKGHKIMADFQGQIPIIKKLVEQSKNAKCYNCEKQYEKMLEQPIVQLQYQRNIPFFQLMYKNGQIDRLEIQNVKNILQKINVQEFRFLTKVNYNPINLIFSDYFPIPPPHVRTQPNPGAFDTGKCFQNQLTQLYQSLIKLLVQKSDEDSIYQIINEIFGTQSKEMKKKINRNSFKEKLDSKKGLIRLNIMQKRMDNSGRAVVECSVDLQIDEAGIPKKILQNMSIPTRVTEKNIQILQQIVNNKQQYPGANYIQQLTEYKNGDKIIKQMDKYRNKGQKLRIGDIVFRHPLMGEYCFLNRQPSLHLFSLIYLKIVPVNGNVIQLNNAICEQTFNADFDGDEMNVFVPIVNQYIEGLKIISSIDNRMTSLNDNKLVIKPNHDTPFGIYIFSKFLTDTVLDRKKVIILLSKTQFDQELQFQETYTGRQILEYIVPKIFHKYLSEPIDGNILQRLFLDFYYFNGGIKTKIFIQSIQNFAFQIIQMFSSTLTLDNCVSTADFQKIQEQFLQLDQEVQEEATRMIIDEKNRIDIEQHMEQFVIQKSLQFVQKIEKQLLDGFDEKTNGYIQMVKSKSKGQYKHILSLLILGIQLQAQQLFKRAAGDRFSAYNPVKYGLKEYNMIYDGLYRGINSQSDYLAQMAFSRMTIFTQKTEARIPGYINRRSDYFQSGIVIGYNCSVMLNEDYMLNPVFGGNGIDVRFQRNQNLEIIQMNNNQINDLFPDNHLKDLSEYLIKLRDIFRYSYYYSQYNWKLQKKYYHPIQYDDLLQQIVNQQQVKQEPINAVQYLQLIQFVQKNIQIMNYDTDDQVFADLDKNNKLMFDIFLISKLNYKKIQESRLTKKQAQLLCKLIIESYNMYRVQPGEAVGLQCEQGFCNDLTQKSINTFHKVSSDGAKYIKIDHLNQLNSYLNKSGNLQDQLIIRFNQKYRKDKSIAEKMKKYLQKKSLKDYVANFIIMVDLFPTSKKINSFTKNGFVCDDFIRINKEQRKIDFINDKTLAMQIINQNPFCIQFELDEYKMQENDLSIYQTVYGLASFLVSQIGEKKFFNHLLQGQLYIFYNNNGKIQIRTYQKENFNYALLVDIIKNIISTVNLNYEFQKNSIDKIFIEKQDFLKFDDKGNVITDYEYVLLIFNEVDNLFFLKEIKYIDYSRCEYNNVKKIQDYMSIVLLQKILYKLIQESSSQLIGEGQLPQNISLISQLMCHTDKVVQINRYGISHIYGSDGLYIAGFESQFTSLIEQAQYESQGDSKNPYTSFILNSCPRIGPNKSQILFKANKKNILSNQQITKKHVFFEIEKFASMKGIYFPEMDL